MTSEQCVVWLICCSCGCSPEYGYNSKTIPQADRRKDHDMKDSASQRSKFRDAEDALMEHVITHLKSAFPDRRILNAFLVLSPQDLRILDAFLVLSPQDLRILDAFLGLSPRDLRILDAFLVLSPQDLRILDAFLALSPRDLRILDAFLVLSPEDLSILDAFLRI